MKRVYLFLTTVVVVYFAAMAYVYMIQRDYMYIPDPAAPPSNFATLHQVEILDIEIEGMATQKSVYRAPAKNRPVILYFHGNGHNVYWRTDAFEQFKAWNVGYLAVEYPGYGGNVGKPNQIDILKTALANYDHLRAQGFSPDQIIIYGHSLGASIAIYIAANREASALILSAPFKSALSMGQKQMPYFPVFALLKDRFRSDLWMANVDEPLLLMHGDIDPVIPQLQGKALFEYHKGEKQFISLKNGKHDVWKTKMPQYFGEWLAVHHP